MRRPSVLHLLPCLLLVLPARAIAEAPPGPGPTSLCPLASFPGPITSRGSTPDTFFEDTHVADIAGRRHPRLVLTAGAPGSGKSTWTRVALENGWVVIAPDEIRLEIVREMAARGETITLRSGAVVTVDPRNPEHIFSGAVATMALARGDQRLREAIAAGRPVVWDSTNTNHARSALLVPARRAGYHTGALVFSGAEASVHVGNVLSRARGGGLDLVDPNTPSADTDRLAIIQRILGELRAQPYQERPDEYGVEGDSPADLRAPGSLDFRRRNDFVNRVEVVNVYDYSGGSK